MLKINIIHRHCKATGDICLIKCIQYHFIHIGDNYISSTSINVYSFLHHKVINPCFENNRIK